MNAQILPPAKYIDSNQELLEDELRHIKNFKSLFKQKAVQVRGSARLAAWPWQIELLVSREDSGKSPKIWESSKVALPGRGDLSPGSDEGAPPRHEAVPSASASGQACPSGSHSSDAPCA